MKALLFADVDNQGLAWIAASVDEDLLARSGNPIGAVQQLHEMLMARALQCAGRRYTYRPAESLIVESFEEGFKLDLEIPGVELRLSLSGRRPVPLFGAED